MKEAASRSSLLGWLFAHAPAGWSGKMCPAYSRAGKEAILPPSYRSSSDGPCPFQTEAGERPESQHAPQGATAWVGECLTLNIPEFNNFQGRSRSEGSVLSLRDILETGPVSDEFSLTEKCAAGILRRAEMRGDRLPEPMQLTLTRPSRST